MPSRFQSSRNVVTWVLLPLIGLLLWLLNASAGWPPKIDYLEIYRRTNLFIHFETEANFAYELQFTELIDTNGRPGPYWTNLYVVKAEVFFNHYVVNDTNFPKINQRFYRLRAFR
jgi:hypothetical protein